MKKTILVVEDEDEISSSIIRKLKIRGFSTILAKNGIQAMKFLTKNHVDLIWLDHYLPEMNGMEFLKHAFDKIGEEMPPVFVISNTATHDRLNQAFQFGVRKYFLKTNYSLNTIADEIELEISK